MITSIKRCTLALIMCGVSAAGMAADILNESFSNIAHGAAAVITGWEFSYCYGRTTAFWTTSILTIETEGASMTNPKKGYAITPTLNYIGSATLSFKYAASASGKPCSISIIVTNGLIDGKSSVDVSASTQTLTNMTYNLTLEKGATIKFQLTSKNIAAIDDVVISPVGITLNDEANNGDIISGAVDMSTDVTIRKLSNGIWNTLCLPFDVDMATMESALGSDQEIKLRTYSSYDATNNVMNFSPVTGDGVISAGTPFLVWFNMEKNDYLTFSGVTVKNTAAQTVTDNGVSFVGTYNPIYLNTDGSNLFLTKTNTLAIPGTGKNQIKGMRAYISLSSSKSMAPARIAFVDEQPTGIRTVETAEVEAGSVPARAAVYSLSGQRLTQPKKGLNIVNGKLTLVK
jgi:hypothetical protein